MCGDFNIDLLQSDKNNSISNCIDNLYSMGLHPLITRPTRVTCQSKTLIDNIFTSDVTSHIQIGLLINDTSEHLPIFQITDIGIHCPKITLFITKGELLRIGIFVKLLVNSRRQNGGKF